MERDRLGFAGQSGGKLLAKPCRSVSAWHVRLGFGYHRLNVLEGIDIADLGEVLSEDG